MIAPRDKSVSADPAASAPASHPTSHPAPNPASPLAIDLEGVALTLAGPAGPVNILTGVSLRVPAGQRLGVVGPSGSGKTSLLMVLAGLERATAGRVQVAGAELGALSQDGLARFRRDHVGIVFQAFHLIPTMTALENVAVPLEFAGLPDAFDRARDQLVAVGLGHRLGHHPGELSGGEQQRVALARAFAVGPQVLLADEPTGNLDGETGARIMDLLFDLRDRHGTTLVLVTHDPELAGRCDRVVRVRDGRVSENDTAQPPKAESRPRAVGVGAGA